MKGVVAIAIALLGAVVSAGEPQWEYGSPRDLRGLTRIYVDTRGDTALRASIVTAIEAALPGVQIVASVKESEAAVLCFVNRSASTSVITQGQTQQPPGGRVVGGSSRVVVGGGSSSTTSSVSVPVTSESVHADVLIVKPGRTENAPLLIASSQVSPGIRNPLPRVVAGVFIRAYKEGNPDWQTMRVKPAAATSEPPPTNREFSPHPHAAGRSHGETTAANQPNDDGTTAWGLATASAAEAIRRGWSHDQVRAALGPAELMVDRPSGQLWRYSIEGGQVVVLFRSMVVEQVQITLAE
jgi:hypothetical protein